MNKIHVSAKQAAFLQRFGGETMSEQLASNLQTLTYTENTATLNAGTLSRGEYEEVRDFMQSVGGKWKGTGGKNEDGSPKGKFLFQFVAPQPIVETFVQMRFLPAKNPLDFFPTPRAAALELLDFCGLIRRYESVGYERATERKLKILEPSAGVGGLCDVIREFYPDAEIHCVEMNPISAYHLREKGFTVFEQDFLAYERAGYYDFVVMNPPFDGTTYLKHVLHAWKMVEPRMGMVAGILPNTLANSQKAIRDFWLWVNCMGAVDFLPKGSFKESGTNVETVVFYLDKEREDKEPQPHYGYPNYGIWHLIAMLENNGIRAPRDSSRNADADDLEDLQKLAQKDTPENRKKMTEVLQRAQGRLMDASGVACLGEEDLAYIVEHFIEKQEEGEAYKEEKKEANMAKKKPQKEEEELIRFSKEALQFVPKHQRPLINKALEEYQDSIETINAIVRDMPVVYGQNGIKDKMVYLHYFRGNADWYILEKDSEKRQLQAFGYVDLGYGGELGYISIEELVDSLTEIDLHFEPRPLSQIREEKQPPKKAGKLLTLSKEARKIVPQPQIDHMTAHLDSYQEEIGALNNIVPKIPAFHLRNYRIEEGFNPMVYLHYSVFFKGMQAHWYVFEMGKSKFACAKTFIAEDGKRTEEFTHTTNLQKDKDMKLDLDFEPCRLSQLWETLQLPPRDADVPDDVLWFSPEAVRFVPKKQLPYIKENVHEYQREIANINAAVQDMPPLNEDINYEYLGKRQPNPMLYLRYSLAGRTWYIFEKGSEFGRAGKQSAVVYFNGGETGHLGYDSVKRLAESAIELDLMFKPCLLSQLSAGGKKPPPVKEDKKEADSDAEYLVFIAGEIRTLEDAENTLVEANSPDDKEYIDFIRTELHVLRDAYETLLNA